MSAFVAGLIALAIYALFHVADHRRWRRENLRLRGELADAERLAEEAVQMNSRLVLQLDELRARRLQQCPLCGSRREWKN